MKISLKQILSIIKKYRNLLRADADRTLVRITEEDLAPQYHRPPEDLNGNFAEEFQSVDANSDISARATPDANGLYQTNIDNSHEIKVDVDIDLTRNDNLEDYANGMTVSPETLEKWIAAGILCPDEIRAAEKLLRMIRLKSRPGHRFGGH